MRKAWILIFLAFFPAASGQDTFTIIDPVDFQLSNGAIISLLPNQSGELIQIDQNLTFTLNNSNTTFYAVNNLTLWNISYLQSQDRLSYRTEGSPGSNLSTNATMGTASQKYQITSNGSNESTTLSNIDKIIKISRLIKSELVEIFKFTETIIPGIPKETVLTLIDTTCMGLCQDTPKIHIYNQEGDQVGILTPKEDIININSTQITLSIDHTPISKINNIKFISDTIFNNPTTIIFILLIYGIIISVFLLIKKIMK